MAAKSEMLHVIAVLLASASTIFAKPFRANWDSLSRTAIRRAISRQDLANHLAVHVGQAHVAAAEAEGLARVVHAKDMQHGRM